ncbi:hypothetical protein ACTHGU_09950 [Chitinophagaceae bacterium MMS25-I14]
MKKALYILGLLASPVFFSQAARAQAGDLGLGLRLTPDGGGATLKYFATRNVAIEGQLNAGGIFGLEGTSVSAVGLAEYHIIFPDPSWRIFFGGGVHIGSWDRDNGDGTEFIFGIDGIGGVEYKFKNIPLGLSADFKPAINFVTDVDFFPHNLFGASARFYLGSGHHTTHHR